MIALLRIPWRVVACVCRSWRYFVLAFDIGLLLACLALAWRVTTVWSVRSTRWGRLPLSVKLLLVTNAGIVAPPVVSLATASRSEGLTALGDQIALVVIMVVVFLLNVMLYRRRERWGRLEVAAWCLALCLGVPRLLVAVSAGRRLEYITMWVYYACISGMLVLNMAPGRTVGLHKQRISVSGTHLLSWAFTALRLLGVAAIAARLMGSSPVRVWPWNRVFLPLWCVDFVGGLGCLHFALIHRVSAPPKRAIFADASGNALPATKHSWLWQAHSGFIVYSLTAGGVGGAIVKVLLAMQLDGVHSFNLWYIAAPVLAQTFLCAAMWLVSACTRYANSDMTCVSRPRAPVPAPLGVYPPHDAFVLLFTAARWAPRQQLCLTLAAPSAWSSSLSSSL